MNMVAGVPSGTLEPMFKTLFRYSRVSSRHANGPLAQERSTFLSHLQSQGVPRSTLLRYATEVPIRIEAETMELSLFYKGFAHLVYFLARAYGHFGFRHPGWEI
jgi:hypothetical protein